MFSILLYAAWQLLWLEVGMTALFHVWHPASLDRPGRLQYLFRKFVNAGDGRLRSTKPEYILIEFGIAALFFLGGILFGIAYVA